MIRNSLDQYDQRPEDMVKYLSNYGWHFTRKMCEFATRHMYKGGKRLNALDKEKVDTILKNAGITLEYNQLYDYVYVANMAYADFYGSSIVNDAQLAKYIKDVIEDEDGYDGLVFNRWYADMCKLGIAIDWEEML